MISYSQSGNNTQGKDQAEQKLFELAQKFNTLLKDSKVNLTLPQGRRAIIKITGVEKLRRIQIIV
jgi:hypothetical protein